MYKGELYRESASYHVCSFVFIGLTSFLCNKKAPSLVPRTPQPGVTVKVSSVFACWKLSQIG